MLGKGAFRWRSFIPYLFLFLWLLLLFLFFKYFVFIFVVGCDLESHNNHISNDSSALKVCSQEYNCQQCCRFDLRQSFRFVRRRSSQMLNLFLGLAYECSHLRTRLFGMCKDRLFRPNGSCEVSSMCTCQQADHRWQCCASFLSRTRDKSISGRTKN